MLPNLTIRQLQTFREVMRAGSISEASRTLSRTQPAVSTMISGIEKQLGLALFAREKGRLVPRPEAYYFLEEAEAVLERLEKASRVMSEFSLLDRGSLRVACHPAGSNSLIPSVLAALLKDRPAVKSDLMMRSSQVVEDLIASQEYDIGLADSLTRRGSIVSEAFELECVVALPAGDPIAERQYVTPTDLAGYPIATLFDEHSTCISLRRAFDDQKATFNRRFVLRTFLPALVLVKAGLCASVVDRITATGPKIEGIVFRPFRPRIASSVSVLRPAHRPPSKLTMEFHGHLCNRLHAIQNDAVA